jgi:hypothetical protein
MVEFLGFLSIAIVFFLISKIAKVLSKATIRHSDIPAEKVGCLFSCYLLLLIVVIPVGGFLFYYKVMDPILDGLHAKKFTEEDAKKAISNFQDSHQFYSDCDSLIFVFEKICDRYCLLPKDSIVESYKRKRNFEGFEMSELDKYTIYSNNSLHNDRWTDYISDNYKKLHAKSFLSCKRHGIFLFSSNDNFVQCINGRIEFDAFILNTREKSIKEIEFNIFVNIDTEYTFTLFLQDNKPHSCQKVIQKVDNIKCKKQNYQIIRIIDVIFNE